MTDKEKMARSFFGFGSWTAPYWFIGPEPGGECDSERIEAWSKDCHQQELCDCKQFHDALNKRYKKSEKKEVRWHTPRKNLTTPILQPTWSKLIRLLFSFKAPSTREGNEHIRRYQQEHWGMFNDETCVIELSGLSAKNFKDSSRESNKEQIEERIANTILPKLNACKPKPKLVVMYGKREAVHWGEIAGTVLEMEKPVKLHGTVFLFVPHPNTRGLNNDQWDRFGKEAKGCI
jgi:hypothetical protein